MHPSGTFQQVPEVVMVNGVRRQTGRMLTYDQSGTLVDPHTFTAVEGAAEAVVEAPAVESVAESVVEPVIEPVAETEVVEPVVEEAKPKKSSKKGRK